MLTDEGFDHWYFPDFSPHGLFRARSHNHVKGSNGNEGLHVFNNEKEFWNPPSDIVKRGRCNDHKESVFYCSNELLTAVIESRPKVGEFVTVGAFESLIEGKRPQHRLAFIGYKYLREIPTLSNMMAKANPDFRGGMITVDEFLNELFHKEIKDNAHYYKLSIAVTKCMMTDIVNGAGDIFKHHGMIYPSILRHHKSFNIVLKPIYARYHKIVTLNTFQVIEYDSTKIHLKLIRYGKPQGSKLDAAQNLDIIWVDLPTDQQQMLTYNLI